MGIINVTPDSFSDQGRYAASEKAIEHAIKLIADGADFLDIGGESSRPGSACVSLDEELNRVIPVIEALKSAAIPISVDTTKPEVMQAAVQAGVSMINDINALRTEGALKIIAESGVMVCLMHMQGLPKTMQDNPLYADVVSEVREFLQQRIQIAQDWGISNDQLVIDPGFGFGKTLQHNLELFRSLDQFTTLNIPVMVGVSRKSMLGTITGNDVNHRTYASIAAAVLAAEKGAKILRVHDVKATKEAILVFNALNR
ncbi:MAG: dihydropteroate synthase [Nitrosomonas sp.]